ncbi:MAG: anti-sigma factor [Acidobacteriia bacterium]|nr:anti-sigma factor [Terriglobia bacterium]
MDGELDLRSQLEIERHIEKCEACAAVYQVQQRVRSAIAHPSLYFQAPAGLDRKIASALRKAERAGRSPLGKSWPKLWRAAGVAAAFAIAAAVIWMAVVLPRRSSEDLIARDVVASHVRSLMPGHLTDVPSSDQHTVKPWFNGRLDFSPPVKDLAAEGFPLVGGRLDYLAQAPVAAAVYRRRQHYINLFMWPESRGGSAKPGPQARQGYNLLHWTGAGMNFWAVSDLNMGELEEFVRLVSS